MSETATQTSTAGSTGAVVADPPELPPDGFDPVGRSADQAQLERFWLPARPDPQQQPALYAQWVEMLSPPLTFVKAGSQQLTTASFVSAWLAPVGHEAKFTIPAALLEGSDNWSGACLLPLGGSRFIQIVGKWTVPEVTVGRRNPDETLPFQCSIWIGLGGKSPWMGSLPQMGTAQSIAEGDEGPEQHLWWQWWVRDAASYPWAITGVSISPGDVVLSSVTAIQPTVARFHVVNRTKRQFTTLQVSNTTEIDGASAEWIVERPSHPELQNGRIGAGPMFPLPDYGEVTFEHCLAALRSGASADLRGASLIQMTETLRHPDRLAVISLPERSSEDTTVFRCVYQPG